MIELTYLKVLIIRKANQKSEIFATIGIFEIKGFKFQPNVCNGCHDLLMMSQKFSNIAIYTLKVLITSVLLAKLAKVRP